ncbi:hypothetical protein KP800_06385 [Agrobacterium pusense]|uniref:RDD family protein n=1 Tax=Agrobacterium pusense TaxID=648995 RepID=A0A6H0ZHX7_9HYPH|nr:hypothetical protein BA939_01965 [Rhizobium sp. S41]KGE84746.1 hypothetical protein LW14_02040 [Rhizobium sp. H41]MDP9733169.1 hypothetical protein [Rhizobium sp. SORGH_AS_0285]MDP9755001.1 hypothetical protein [Rhizobium sp. SORGH_AS_0260]MDR6082341.1 hypothetical protein [Agrobacterium sp. SORGH_AS_0440]NRF08476.1 hypothetical protein [Agrobacterium pusense]HAU75701.1 hypothetical protein [Agrobacterium sp.]
MTDETLQPKQPATWRIILAFFLDFWTAFFAAGFLVATVAGGRTPGGFALNGAPAFIAFVLIIAYFVVLGRFFGGTLWQRLLKARR